MLSKLPKHEPPISFVTHFLSLLNIMLEVQFYLQNNTQEKNSNPVMVLFS